MEAKTNNALRENVKTFIWAAIIAVLIRSLLVQPFNIPSSSMKPTLLIGDFSCNQIQLWLFAPSRLRQTCFQGGRWLITRAGDVVVFKLPADNRTDFIKRVMGCPVILCKCAAALYGSTARWNAKRLRHLSIMFRGRRS